MRSLLFLLAALHLQVVPANVYKVDDPGGAQTSSFVFNVSVICSDDCALTPVAATVELSSAGSLVERQVWTATMLAKIRRTNYLLQPDTPIAAPQRLFSLPEAFDLRFFFRDPQAFAIDAATLHLTIADAKGHRAEQTLKIPIQTYKQKTSLIFPFRGRGRIGQDWITNGGHGGIFADFAIDVIGLDQNYAAQINDSNTNEASVGWGREIIAPAAGTVVYARNDVPNNTGGRPDLSSYAGLPDPAKAYGGNCVVIDHGNSEYSAMMHLQQGSVTVKIGDRVAAGQVIGKLGNSGDSFGPHLHYQLQSGPQIFHDQSLPISFQNIDGPLSRGTYINAK